MDAARLEGMPLFADLDGEERADVAGRVHEVTVEAGGELVYALTRAVAITASYEHTRHISFSDGSDYEETEGGAGVRISR